jgi:hypothetical protein
MSGCGMQGWQRIPHSRQTRVGRHDPNKICGLHVPFPFFPHALCLDTISIHRLELSLTSIRIPQTLEMRAIQVVSRRPTQNDGQVIAVYLTR